MRTEEENGLIKDINKGRGPEISVIIAQEHILIYPS